MVLGNENNPQQITIGKDTIETTEQVPGHPNRQQTRYGRALGTRKQRLQLHTQPAQNAETTGLQPTSPCHRLQEPHQQLNSSQRHHYLFRLRKRQKLHDSHPEARAQNHGRQRKRHANPQDQGNRRADRRAMHAADKQDPR